LRPYLPLSRITGDGWYGIQYRGGVQAIDTTVSFAIQTLDANMEMLDDPDRIFNSPFINLTAGTPYPKCPWDAPWDANLVVTFAVTFPSLLAGIKPG